MWAENFEEWFKRNPAYFVEVIVLDNGKHRLGFVTNLNVDNDWLNKNMCVTGHGYGSRELCEAAHMVMGTNAKCDICGCEKPDESPSLIQSYGTEDLQVQFTCTKCKRSWLITKEEYRNR